MTTAQFLADAEPSTTFISLCNKDGFPDKLNGDYTSYYHCSDGWVEIDTYLDTVHPVQEWADRGVGTVRVKQATICTSPTQ